VMAKIVVLENEHLAAKQTGCKSACGKRRVVHRCRIYI